MHCRCFSDFFLQLNRLSTRSTLFPYTTLFRSSVRLLRRGKRDIARELLQRRMNLGIETAVVLAAQIHTTRSEEHTSELQSRRDLVCRLLLEKKKIQK